MLSRAEWWLPRLRELAWQLSIPDDESGFISGGEIGYVGVSKTTIRKYARLAAFGGLCVVVNGIKCFLKSISYEYHV